MELKPCDDSGKCDIVGPFEIHKSRAATLEEAAEVWSRSAKAGGQTMDGLISRAEAIASIIMLEEKES